MASPNDLSRREQRGRLCLIVMAFKARSEEEMNFKRRRQPGCIPDQAPGKTRPPSTRPLAAVHSRSSLIQRNALFLRRPDDRGGGAGSVRYSQTNPGTRPELSNLGRPRLSLYAALGQGF